MKAKLKKIFIYIVTILITVFITKHALFAVIKLKINSEIKDKYGEDFKIVHSKSFSVSDLEEKRTGSYVISSGYSSFYVASENEKIVFEIWNYSEIPAVKLENYTTNVDIDELEIAKKIISKLGDKADYYAIKHLSLNVSTPSYKIDSPYYSFEFLPLSENDIDKGDFDKDLRKVISGRIGTDFEKITY